MPTEVEALYRLQQIELEMIKHQKQLKTIADQLKDRQMIEQAEAAMRQIQESLQPLQKQLREYERQIQTHGDKASAASERLYSGDVKNPKELQDLQAEITAQNRRKDELETQSLELLEQIEALEAELAAAEATLASITARWEAEHSDLLNQKATLEAAYLRLKGERESAMSRIHPEALQRYSQLRAAKANQPIALLKNRICSACGIEQTTLIEQAARQDDAFVYCLNCGRILYYVL